MNGERYWFQMCEQPGGDPGPWYRRFIVVRLTPAQLREEESWHDLFRRCVGTHADYDGAGCRAIGVTQPQERHAEFYDAYQARVPMDLSDNEVVGWFET